ncbi:MAG: 2-dehydropantoate 2-reductase [Pseudomonadota bacterium]
MKICVFGAGAIGGLLGIKLALAGHHITLIARGAHLAAMKKNGATLLSAGKTLVARPFVTDDPAAAGAQDYVIVTLKAPAAPAAAPFMRPLLGPATPVVTAMNGIPYWYFHDLPGPWRNRRVTSVDPEGKLWDNVPPARAIGCVTYAAGRIEAPGVIRHTFSNRFVLGEPGGGDSERVRRLSAALVAAGFEAPVAPDIRKETWLKLWGNASFNPVSVLTLATLDVLASDPDSRAVLAPMMVETQGVASRLGVEFAIDVDARMRMAKEVGAHKTSMLQDLERGRPLEIDALLGAIVEIARLVGVATPACDLVLALVRQRARLAGLL